MKKLLPIILISIAAIISGESRISAEEISKKPEKPQPAENNHYKGSISALGGITMAGVQGEYTFIPEIGIRIVGLCIFGANFNDMNRDEYILSGIVAPVLHLAPEFKVLDPVLMIGLVYSYHHWETKSFHLGISPNITVREGNIHDVTFGSGFGFVFKFADRLKAGLNLWLNYDYGVITTPSLRKKKGSRILLPVPLIEFTVQF